jgi:putative serine protease PepD
VAELVEADGFADLAVIRLSSTLGGKELTASDLSELTTVPLGSSAAMSSGDEIVVMGFPGVAESKSVTVTSGRFSSRADGPAGKDQYINTDAKFDHGNSGGLAANDDGQLIGVPTREDRTDPSCSKVATDSKGNPVYQCESDRQGRLVAVDLARPLIDAAEDATR